MGEEDITDETNDSESDIHVDGDNNPQRKPDEPEFRHRLFDQSGDIFVSVPRKDYTRSELDGALDAVTGDNVNLDPDGELYFIDIFVGDQKDTHIISVMDEEEDVLLVEGQLTEPDNKTALTQLMRMSRQFFETEEYKQYYPQ